MPPLKPGPGHLTDTQVQELKAHYGTLGWSDYIWENWDGEFFVDIAIDPPDAGQPTCPR